MTLVNITDEIFIKVNVSVSMLKMLRPMMILVSMLGGWLAARLESSSKDRAESE